MPAERRLILLLTGIQFTHILDFVLMMPLGPTLMRAFDLSAGQFALLVSSYTFSAGAAGILGGFFLDRFERRRAILAIYAAFFVATVAMALAPTHHLLMAARILAGAAGGLLGSLVMAVIAERIPYERRGAATGAVFTAFSAASIIGIPAGVTLCTAFGWHAAFLGLAVVTVPIWVWTWAAMPESPPPPPSEPPLTTLREAFLPARHRWAFLLVGLQSLAGFSVIPFISPHLVGNVGFRDDDLKYFYLLGGLATVVTGPAIGRWADRRGKHAVYAILCLASMVPILLLTHLPLVPMPAALAVTTLFMVLVSGRFIPSMALIGAAADPARRGSVLSFSSAVQSIASGVAALIAGLLVVKAPDGHLLGFPLVGYLAVASTLACLFVARRVQPVPESRP